MYPYNLERNGDEMQYYVPEPGSIAGQAQNQNHDQISVQKIPGPGVGPGFNQGPKLGPGFGPGPRHGDERPPFGHDHHPPGHPPDRIPEKRASVYAVDPGAIRNCLHRNTYVWLINGSSFWMYPTFVGRKSVSGYRWTRFGWAYIGIDLDLIETFYCAPF